MTNTRTVTIAHSPDADDAFMFCGLATEKVGTPGIKYEHVLKDIQTLNEDAYKSIYDVTAMSVHAYAYLNDRYKLLRSGASMGEANYGPMVVAREPMTYEQLSKTVVAVPGKLTTAYLLLQLAMIDKVGRPCEVTCLPFDQILPAVRDGKVAAGLLIHEGQLTFAEEGLSSVLELFSWWHERHALPTPLGVNGIRADMPADLAADVARDVRASIEYALANRDEAVAYARQFARDLPRELIDRFVGMYVNQRTVYMGEDECKSVELLLNEAAKHKLIPAAPKLEWVEASQK